MPPNAASCEPAAAREGHDGRSAPGFSQLSGPKWQYMSSCWPQNASRIHCAACLERLKVDALLRIADLQGVGPQHLPLSREAMLPEEVGHLIGELRVSAQLAIVEPQVAHERQVFQDLWRQLLLAR